MARTVVASTSIRSGNHSRPARPAVVGEMGSSSVKPVKVGICGLGTVGGGTFNVLERNAEEIARRAGRGIEVAQIAARRPNPKCDTGATPITADIFDVACNPEIDVVVELIGGYTLAHEPGAQGHRERQARGHREQGADRRARQRDLRQGPREGRDRRLRGRCRRRHPGDQGDPRGAVGQPHQLAGRDHQRYRQLHPQRNAREGPYLPRRARRGPGPGLCRGRPDLRRGRHRRRPQADHPRLDRLRHSAAVRQGLHRRHLETDQRRRQLRRRPRLSHQAPGRGASHRERLRSCACTRP